MVPNYQGKWIREEKSREELNPRRAESQKKAQLNIASKGSRAERATIAFRLLDRQSCTGSVALFQTIIGEIACSFSGTDWFKLVREQQLLLVMDAILSGELSILILYFSISMLQGEIAAVARA